MTTVLFAYLLLGLVLGWFARGRVYEKRLKAFSEQMKKAAEALGKSNALTLAQGAKIAALEATIKG